MPPGTADDHGRPCLAGPRESGGDPPSPSMNGERRAPRLVVEARRVDGCRARNPRITRSLGLSLLLSISGARYVVGVAHAVDQPERYRSRSLTRFIFLKKKKKKENRVFFVSRIPSRVAGNAFPATLSMILKALKYIGEKIFPCPFGFVDGVLY